MKSKFKMNLLDNKEGCDIVTILTQDFETFLDSYIQDRFYQKEDGSLK